MHELRRNCRWIIWMRWSMRADLFGELAHGGLIPDWNVVLHLLHWCAVVLLFLVQSGVCFPISEWTILPVWCSKTLRWIYRDSCCLLGGIYNCCSALGITRSPGYIRNSCVRTLRPYQDKDHILVIWSSHHHSSIGSNGKSQSINLGNILCSNTHLSALGCPLALIVNARLISNKSFILNDLFISYSLDLFVTETWLKQGDFRVLLGENDPSVCASFRSPPASGYGSGVATISRNC